MTAEERKIRENNIGGCRNQRQKKENGGERIDESTGQSLWQRLLFFMGYFIGAVAAAVGGDVFIVKAA